MIMLDEQGNQKRTEDEATPSPPITSVYFLLDATGSMAEYQEATIDGFNEYINGLQKKGANILMSLTLFNSEKTEVRYQRVPVAKIEPLTSDTYVPECLTPLYDAIGRTLKEAEGDDADKRLVVIMTDGLENASREYTLDGVKAMIAEREKKGWDFVYLGSNHDAWRVGKTIGLPQGNVMAYSQANTRRVFGAMGQGVSSYSVSGSVGTQTFFKDAGQSEEDYKEKKRQKNSKE